MSLGFLTESALLPSKAKAIKVDAKSLVDLRAVVFQKEQERDARKRKLRDVIGTGDDDTRSSNNSGGSAHDGDGAPGKSAASRTFGRYAHLRATRRRGTDGSSLSRAEEQIGKVTNRGVEKRRRRDEDARELELDDRDDDRAWHRKSREALERKSKLYDEMASGGGDGGASGAEWLVDFGAKPRADVVPTREQVEITDEFGRARVVATDSREYAEFIERQDRRESSSTAAPAQDAHLTEKKDAEGSGGGFVVSQWEKRLNAQEKTFLQEVHASAAHAKSALLDKKARKQLRLEKLRRQQAGSEGGAAAAVTTAAPRAAMSAEDEQAASAKATAFLNQLGALM